ncbi:amidoligase family protein [Microvirga aerilata]|uniref:amidoligase family protein n=1 Tax=Microvirga aerilata TaxID=670292 RepID=UPI0036448CB4
MAQPALSTSIDFALPPILHNEQGRMRTVGVEIEFVGPSAEKTVQALQEALGGRLIEEDPHAFALRSRPSGT